MLVERAFLRREEPHVYARIGETPHVLDREVAPCAPLVDDFHQPRDFRLHGSRVGLRGDVRLIRRTLRKRLGTALVVVPTDECREEIECLHAAFDVGQQLAVVVRRLPARSRNIDQTHSAQGIDKSFALGSEQNDVVFHHLDYHIALPSLAAACWRVLTIFCADLERFSSSSMNRLILRMASSYPGICTFS